MIRLCRDCRWIGRRPQGFGTLARCLHPSSERHELSCLIAPSRERWANSDDLCGELGRHWEPRDRGEPVSAAGIEPPRGRGGGRAGVRPSGSARRGAPSVVGKYTVENLLPALRLAVSQRRKLLKLVSDNGGAIYTVARIVGILCERVVFPG
jgi:hypothetical protein